MSQMNPSRDRANETRASCACSKYLPVMPVNSTDTRSRNASESSTCFPETVICISHRPSEHSERTRRHFAQAERGLESGGYRLDSPATHGVRDVHRLPVFGHRSARDVHTFSSQDRDNLVIGQNAVRLLGGDQLANAMA